MPEDTREEAQSPVKRKVKLGLPSGAVDVEGFGIGCKQTIEMLED